MIIVYLLSQPAVFPALRIFGAVICVSGYPRQHALAGCHSASERRLTCGTGEKWSSTTTDEFHHIGTVVYCYPHGYYLFIGCWQSNFQSNQVRWFLDSCQRSQCCCVIDTVRQTRVAIGCTVPDKHSGCLGVPGRKWPVFQKVIGGKHH